MRIVFFTLLSTTALYGVITGLFDKSLPLILACTAVLIFGLYFLIEAIQVIKASEHEIRQLRNELARAITSKNHFEKELTQLRHQYLANYRKRNARLTAQNR